MFLGKVMKKSTNQNTVFKHFGISGIVILLLSFTFLYSNADYHFNDYYHSRPGAMIFMCGFVLLWLYINQLIIDKLPSNKLFDLFFEWSKGVTNIYFVQWIIIVWSIGIWGHNGSSYVGVILLILIFTLLSHYANRLLYYFSRITMKTKSEKVYNIYSDLQRIDRSEIEEAKKIFALAMFDDVLHKYFFPDEKSRIEKLQYFYEFKLKTMLLNTYKTSEKHEGFCIWEKPNEHRSAITFNDVIEGFSLAFNLGIFSLVRMIRYQFWSTKQKRRLVSDPYWYLDTVVVSPYYQGKGFASKMIKPILSTANAKGEKVYLETQNIKNVSIYEKYGFKLISTQYLNNQVTHYAMVK
jgi:GNAT superfamily N-acetyltransferase